jgi:SAM-dependent methyltransferase
MDFAAILNSVVDQYPASIGPGQRTQIGRMSYEMSLFVPYVSSGGRVCDLGGGWGTIALGCAAAGLKAVLVDDYRERGFFEVETMAAMRALYEKYGVEVVSRDLVTEGLGFPAGSLDAVTCFDSIEHWHGSPKKALHDALRALCPGGRFVVATPNCVNLRKRITVPLGRGKWSSLSEWYEHELFRGHVREPDVDDLRFIASDLGLKDVRIEGRNWNGYYSGRRLVRALTRVFDLVLRLKPSLCSDLYLTGFAPQ